MRRVWSYSKLSSGIYLLCSNRWCLIHGSLPGVHQACGWVAQVTACVFILLAKCIFFIMTCCTYHTLLVTDVAEGRPGAPLVPVSLRQIGGLFKEQQCLGKEGTSEIHLHISAMQYTFHKHYGLMSPPCLPILGGEALSPRNPSQSLTEYLFFNFIFFFFLSHLLLHFGQMQIFAQGFVWKSL